MVVARIVAVALVVAGLLALVYGGFSYSQQTYDAKVGPLELSLHDKKTVTIPVWAGIAAVVAGAGLLFASGRKG
jgi:TRAP-type C4-dicarboxylate transport system permease small subunit